MIVGLKKQKSCWLAVDLRPPPPPPGSSALGTRVLPWYRCLVPDIVVEKREGTQRQEILIVSIKGGHKLDQKKFNSIKVGNVAHAYKAK